MPLSPEQLAQEATAATNALVGKVVARVVRHRGSEVLVEFADGTRLFVDRSADGIEISITGGQGHSNIEVAP
jgi:hypothetical protein